MVRPDPCIPERSLQRVAKQSDDRKWDMLCDLWRCVVCISQVRYTTSREVRAVIN